VVRVKSTCPVILGLGGSKARDEHGGRKMESKGWKMEGGRWRVEDGGLRVEDGE
jgi:hypothetical protein